MIRKLTAAALAVLLVTAGAATAAPGQAPSDSPADDHANESTQHDAATESTNSSDDTETARTPAAENGSANDSERGPPTDVPSQAPDHVERIHDAINEWLDGDREGSLGATIAELLGGGESDARDRRADSDTANQTGTPTDADG